MEGRSEAIDEERKDKLRVLYGANGDILNDGVLPRDVVKLFRSILSVELVMVGKCESNVITTKDDNVVVL